VTDRLGRVHPTVADLVPGRLPRHARQYSLTCRD
jgi:hypothetical protein